MGEKKDDAPPATFVFKLDMRCDCQGCADKIKKAVRGAEDFKVDRSANELTVIGKVDPAKIRDNLKKEFPKKEVEIVSRQPKKDAFDGNKKPKKADEKKSYDKKDQDEKSKEKRGDKPEKKADKEKSNDKKHQDKKPKENELNKVKREVKEKEEPIKLVKLEAHVTVIQVEVISQELEEARNKTEHARNEAERAQNKAERAQTCEECGKMLSTCPICGDCITIRIKLI